VPWVKPAYPLPLLAERLDAVTTHCVGVCSVLLAWEGRTNDRIFRPASAQSKRLIPLVLPPIWDCSAAKHTPAAGVKTASPKTRVRIHNPHFARSVIRPVVSFGRSSGTTKSYQPEAIRNTVLELFLRRNVTPSASPAGFSFLNHDGVLLWPGACG